MTQLRTYSLAAGVSYLLTFVSIPTLSLYAAVRLNDYVVGSGPDMPVMIGALLEMVMALACIGTAVALYPVVKRQGPARAMGFVGARVLEAAVIYSGFVSLMSIVTLRQVDAGPAAVAAAQGLAAQYQWSFFFAQSFIPAINALLLGTLLYQSRLVPRVLPIIGFLGAATLTVSWFAIYFGAWGASSPVAGLMALPIAAWEFSLGVYLVVKGFRPSPVTEGM